MFNTMDMSTENPSTPEEAEGSLRELLHRLVRAEFADPTDQQHVQRMLDVSFESIRDVDAILDEDLEATVITPNGGENHV